MAKKNKNTILPCCYRAEKNLLTTRDCKTINDMNNFKTSSAMDINPTFRILTRTLLVIIVFLIGTQLMHAQETKTVNGIVISPESKPVPNVSVSVEGSRDMPAFTDEEGKFSINLGENGAWINVAPAADYKKKRVFVGKRNELKIMLTPIDIAGSDDEIILLNQPVAVKNVVSSFSSVNTENIHHTAVTSIDNYMQGRVAGMHVLNQSGAPGSGAVTQLRGVNSINATNQPLYVVDGAIMEPTGLFGTIVNGYNYNPLLSINPLDISNTNVMKDPVYQAAYGSKASNGLVMIQTLDPSATETSFDIDLRRGLTLKPEQYIPQLDANQYKTLANEILFSSGAVEEDIIEKYPNLFLEPEDLRFIDYQHNTNWQQQVFENSSFTNFNVKVKGGDEIARYGLSFGYYNSSGILKNTSYDGYNIRFVSLVNIFTWLRMNAAVSFNTSNMVLKESALVEETSPILSALSKSPLLNPYQYDAEGVETRLLSEVDEFGVSNPLATINNFDASSSNYHITTSLGFEADLGENLFLRTNVGILYNSLKERMFMPNKGMESYYDDEAYNVAKASANVYTGFSNNTMLVYNKKIDSDHAINSTTGLNIMTNQFQYDFGVAKNAHENDEYRMLADGRDNLREVGGSTHNWNWMSIYEKISYVYQDKYLFTGTVSLDGSSRVGRDADKTLNLFGQPFGIFYSAGLGWRVSNEGFLDDISWLDEFKIRASIGRTGNDDIGETNATNFYQSLRYRESTGIVPSTFPNYKLTYEFNTQYNIGADVALWGNRVKATFDFFKTDISDMLVYMPLDVYLGYNFRPENAGAMENTGWDATLFIRLVNARSFKWDIETTLSHVQNSVTKMPHDKFVTSFNNYELVNMVGEQVNSFYGYRFNGVYATSDDAAAAGLVNERFKPYGAGDAIFEDISGPDGKPDGQINSYDKTTIGSPLPEYIGGIVNTFRYKNWTLSAYVNFVTGNEVYNYLRFKNEAMVDFSNQSKNVLNRWQYENQSTDVPRALWNDPIGNSAFSTRWIEDGSFLRLKNISLSYKIPHEFLAFKSAEFYVSASNLFTFSKYLGYDPEFAYSYHLNQQGIDFGQIPQSRQFLVGIKIGL